MQSFQVQNFQVQSFHVFETAAGFCSLAWNAEGRITCFRLPVASADAAERVLLRRLPGAKCALPAPHIAETVEAATRYFQGQQTDFAQTALDLGPQTAFFHDVYEAVRKLRWGQTTTYGAVAKDLGAGPEAARDVGEAMAKNPVPLIIPCHRVLAAGRRIGGFSAPGGSAAKARMLALEGVDVAPPPPAQHAFGF